MTSSEVEAKIGTPSTTTKKDGSVFWKYDELGLQLRFVQDRLLYLDQTSGRITDDLAVGDDEGYLATIATLVNPDSSPRKTFRVKRRGFVYTFTCADGKIIESRFGTDDVP